MSTKVKDENLLIMKKLLLLLSLVISVSIYAAVELKSATNNSIFTTNNAGEDYKYIKHDKGLAINIKDGSTHSCDYNLYEGANTCYAYYIIVSGNVYLPAHKNEQSTYKNVDVSSFNYYAQKGDYRYFFFY